MRKIVLNTIEFYQRAISPMMAPRCRFYPSCSSYAHEAVTSHGIGRGVWLSVVRLSKCHPLHRGGIDLVPPRKPNNNEHVQVSNLNVLDGEQQHG